MNEQVEKALDTLLWTNPAAGEKLPEDVVSALSALRAELARLGDENKRLAMVGDDVLALYRELQVERDALKAELERLGADVLHWKRVYLNERDRAERAEAIADELRLQLKYPDPEDMPGELAAKYCPFNDPLHFHHDGCPSEWAGERKEPYIKLLLGEIRALTERAEKLRAGTDGHAQGVRVAPSEAEGSIPSPGSITPQADNPALSGPRVMAEVKE